MFSDNLKLIRKEQGLSQEELAAKLHVVRQTISKWEKGISVPDADLLVRLSELLETPVATLLGNTIEASADVNVIAQQLEQMNATLAENNRRGRHIWRVIITLLLVSVIISIAVALAGTITYKRSDAESEFIMVVQDRILMVNDILYYDTNETGPMGDSGAVAGEILSTVEAGTIPAESGQSNFGEVGASYTYDSGDGFIMVFIDNEWYVFLRDTTD